MRHCRVWTDENSMSKSADLNNYLAAKQQPERRKCNPSHPKRPRLEKLRSQTDSPSIRPTFFRTKATMMHAVFLLSLVMVDCSYLPISKVLNKSEIKGKSPVTALRLPQEQLGFWEDPTERDVTPAPVPTNDPTMQPIIQPITMTSSEPPTLKPFSAPATIDSSTPKPTVSPGDESQELLPSGAPSVKLSEFPSIIPSRSPSRSPVAAPSQVPTAIPSGAPSKDARSLQPSNFPTDRFTQGLESEEGGNDVNLAPVSLPMSFKARLEGVRESDIDELLPRVATIWRTFFREALEERFGQSSFGSVQLAVTAENERRRLRILQKDKVVEVLDIYARGQISMRFDSEEADIKKLELRSFLDETISRENLQNALTSSNTNFAVTVEGQSENGQTIDDKPKLWEIILGFSILAIAVGTIVFWALIFWRKREKRIRKKKLAAIRSAPMDLQSSGMASPGVQSSSFRAQSKLDSKPLIIRPLSEGPRQVNPALNAKSNVFTGRGLPEKDSDDDYSDSKGLGSDDSDTGSEFGRQLRMAASLDKASWEEFQRQKQTLEAAARSGISSGGEHNGVSDRYNASLYEMGNGGEGIEVEHGGTYPMIFPYGDEKRNVVNSGALKEVNSSRNRSSINDADRYGTQDHGDLEPYGDSKDIPPVSFPGKIPYPLVRPELSDSGSSDERSNSSFRASPTGSSWSGGDLTDTDEPVGTLSMLKEVEQLSQYVQHYEQKRESRKLRELELKQREFENKQRLHLSMSTASQEREERQFRDFNPSRTQGTTYSEQVHETSTERQFKSTPLSATATNRSTHRTDEVGVDYPGDRPREAYAIPQRSVLPASFESFHSSTDLSEAEDDVSQRLGIIPHYPLVSDNNSNIHNRRDHSDAKGDRPLEAENRTQDEPSSSNRRQSTQSKSVSEYRSASKPSAKSSRTQSYGEETHLPNNSQEYDRSEGQPPSPSNTLKWISRSAQGKISNIVTMFESKPHTAVVPPSPSWQYEN